MWCVVFLSPLQALQGMHVLCRHGEVCSTEQAIEAPAEEVDDCCCCEPARGDVEAVPSTETLPFSPCPCEPDCWCHHPIQPQLPCQVASEVFSSFQLAPIETGIRLAVDESVIGGARLKYDVRPLSAQETCVSLCRFLT